MASKLLLIRCSDIRFVPHSSFKPLAWENTDLVNEHTEVYLFVQQSGFPHSFQIGLLWTNELHP